MMLCVLLLLKFYSANSEWVEISPILTNKNISGSLKSTTPNYENILVTPFAKNYIFTTPIYGLAQTSSSSVVNVDKNKIKRRLDVTNNEKRPTNPMVFNEDDNFTNKDDNYEGFFSFLQMVQDKLMSYKTTSQKSKLSVLKHLRDNLLQNVHQRIAQLWVPTVSKEARGYKDDEEEEYHMGFPSNEGALMTIGFLTFAVFLIKLVIKLVQALKRKYEYYGTTTTTTTAASIIFLNRKKRDEIIEDSSKIRQYIEEFPNTFLGNV